MVPRLVPPAPAPTPQLRELWLGRNRITQISGLDTLANLRRISVQSNRLTSMLGLERCTALEELYLSHNGIQRLEGLSSLPHLRMLDVSSNMLTAIEPGALAGNTQLEDLWLNDNQLPAIDAALDRALEPVRHSLTCIYLEGNPAVSGVTRIFLVHVIAVRVWRNWSVGHASCVLCATASRASPWRATGR